MQKQWGVRESLPGTLHLLKSHLSLQRTYIPFLPHTSKKIHLSFVEVQIPVRFQCSMREVKNWETGRKKQQQKTKTENHFKIKLSSTYLVKKGEGG